MKTCDCSKCPAFRQECEGCTEPCRYQECDAECAQCPIRCSRRDNLDQWLTQLDGLSLDMPLRPQPPFRLRGYLPQLLNGLEVPAMLQRTPDAAVGIAKVLTSRGRISRRALPYEFGPRNIRPQWGLNELTRLTCIGNYLDDYLEQLWAAQLRAEERADSIWMKIGVLGFEMSTSLNFSIYLDDPRMEHLVNIKRSWLTAQQMQATSALTPIPHLQWGTVLDLQRQLHYAQERGFHTLTMNLQLTKRQGWDVVAMGLSLIQAQAPEMRFLFSGVVSLKRLAYLARTFPTAAFTSTNAHYLAQRHVRLTRDGTRLIKEPVEGQVDLILAENIGLYHDFLAEVNGEQRVTPRRIPPQERAWLAAFREVTAALQSRFGYAPAAAADAFDLLSTDEAVLAAFRAWLREGELNRSLRHAHSLTLGDLLDQGADPLDAFLHLGYLAQQAYEELEVQVGEAGY